MSFFKIKKKKNYFSPGYIPNCLRIIVTLAILILYRIFNWALPNSTKKTQHLRGEPMHLFELFVPMGEWLSPFGNAILLQQLLPKRCPMLTYAQNFQSSCAKYASWWCVHIICRVQTMETSKCYPKHLWWGEFISHRHICSLGLPNLWERWANIA